MNDLQIIRNKYLINIFPAGNYRQWRRFSIFIVNFEHISHLVLVFLMLTLSR